MRRRWLLGGGAVLALLAGWAWWRSGREVGPGPEDAPLESRAAAGVAPPEAASAPLLRGDPREPPAPGAAGPATLHGRVLDAAKRTPIAGAAVSAFGYEDLRRLATATADDGTFRFPETAGRAGAFHLAVTAPGHGRFTDDAARATLEPRTVLLETEGALEGRLVEAADESAVRRFRVVALRRPGRFTDAMSVRNALPLEQDVGATLDVEDPQGRFRVGGLPAGTYALLFLVEDRCPFFWSGGKASFQEGGFAVAAGATGDAGTARLPRSETVVVRVLDAASERPLAGATFEGSLLVDERSVPLPLRPLEVRRGSDYVLALPFDEQHRLQEVQVLVHVPGYASAVTGGYGQSPGETFVVRMAAPATLAGTVRLGTGDDAGWIVLVRRDVDRGVVGSATTDARGEFTVPDLPSGTALEVLAFERAADRLRVVVPLELTPAETRVLRLGAPGATGVEGRVLVGGKPVADAWAFLDDAQDRRTRCPTDEDGRFRFEGVPAGRGRLFLNLDASGREEPTYVERPVVVEEGRITRVAVDLAAEIRGRLSARGTDGTPADVDGKSVVAHSPGASPEAAAWAPETRTRADGSFTLALPGPGPWVVDLDEEDLLLADGPVSVEVPPPPGVAAPVTLSATVDPRDGRIEIAARDAETGEPVSDAGYDWTHRHTVGTGSAEGTAPLVLENAGLGPYAFVIDAAGYVATSVAVEVTPKQREVKASVSLPRSEAVRVKTVDAAGPAAAAGLRDGDLILRYGDARVRNVDELVSAAKAASPADLVRLEIVRNGASQTLTVHGGRLGVEIENARAAP